MGSLQSKLHEFNRLTNNGRIFDLDLSKRDDLGVRLDERREELILTTDEINEREQWVTLKEALNPFDQVFFRLRHRTNKAEDLLKMQVAAPVLHPDPKEVSHRSAMGEFRANRWYPPQIETWDQFPSAVNAFSSDLVVKNAKTKKGPWKNLDQSFEQDDLLTKESQEQEYLRMHVMLALEKVGLIGKFEDGDKGLVARPDFHIRCDQKHTIVIGETKSTQNLLLPMKAEQIKEQYNDVLAALNIAHHIPTGDQVRAWSHVGHPMVQLIGYLVLNHCRYGILTSGTRTYFVHIARENNEDVVRISDAWFIGQPKYLRAIAAIYKLALDDRSPRLLTSGKEEQGWLRLTPDATKTGRDRKRAKRARLDEDPGRQRPQTRGMNRQNEPAVADIAFPTNTLDVQHIGIVDFEEIEIKTEIGYGRCGTCFSAQWKNEEVALKVFDATKLGGKEAFAKEIKAYVHLEGAWGKLVPKPRFVSEAFGVLFLGMQMAQPAPQDACIDDWGMVLDELETKYKFRHLDVFTGERGSDWRNLMTVYDEKGKYHPIVIDLEDYEIFDQVEESKSEK